VTSLRQLYHEFPLKFRIALDIARRFGAGMTKAGILLALLSLAGILGVIGRAQPKLALPKGVVRVSFGTAHRYFGPGKEMCVVVYPLPSAVFQRGITELTYAVELEPKMVKRASAQVIGSSPDQLRSVPCNVFTPISGGFSQTQIGSTISRVDKGPLAPGQYTLRIMVDGQSADVPFSIK
jgi:hypothetical protein